MAKKKKTNSAWGKKSIGGSTVAPVSNNMTNNTNDTGAKVIKEAKENLNSIINMINSEPITLDNTSYWQSQVDESKALVEKVTVVGVRDDFLRKMNKMQDIINASTRVCKMEEFLKKNPNVLENKDMWLNCLELSITDIKKIDQNIYKNQYLELSERYNSIKVRVDDKKTESNIDHIIGEDSVLAINNHLESIHSLSKENNGQVLIELIDSGTLEGDDDDSEDDFDDSDDSDDIEDDESEEGDVMSEGNSNFVISANNDVTISEGADNVIISPDILGITNINILTIPSGINVNIDGVKVEDVVIRPPQGNPAACSPKEVNISASAVKRFISNCRIVLNVKFNTEMDVVWILQSSIINVSGRIFDLELYKPSTVNASGTIYNLVSRITKQGIVNVVVGNGGMIFYGIYSNGYDSIVGFDNKSKGQLVKWQNGVGYEVICPTVAKKDILFYIKPKKGYNILRVTINGVEINTVGPNGEYVMPPEVEGEPEYIIKVEVKGKNSLEAPKLAIDDSTNTIVGLTNHMEVREIKDGVEGLWTRVTDIYMYFEDGSIVEVRNKTTGEQTTGVTRLSFAKSQGEAHTIETLTNELNSVGSFNLSEHLVANIEGTVEFSTNAGDTWVEYNGGNLPDFRQCKPMTMRVCGGKGTAPCKYIEVHFVEKDKLSQKPPTGLRANASNNTISGLSSAMEVSVNGGAWKNVVDPFMGFANGCTVNVRYAGTLSQLKSDPTVVSFNKERKQPPDYNHMIVDDGQNKVYVASPEGMEYSINNEEWIMVNPSGIISEINGNSNIRIRYAETDTHIASGYIIFKFTDRKEILNNGEVILDNMNNRLVGPGGKQLEISRDSRRWVPYHKEVPLAKGEVIQVRVAATDLIEASDPITVVIN
ncbi:MAG: hypothetical protein RR838_10100 [Clostridium sp.]